jgi:hypothetical protein
MDSIKLNAIKKVVKDIMDLSDLADANDDAQIRFIAETMKVVLLAGNNANHAERMGRHVCNFLGELEMVNGECTASEHLMEEPICEN